MAGIIVIDDDDDGGEQLTAEAKVIDPMAEEHTVWSPDIAGCEGDDTLATQTQPLTKEDDDGPKRSESTRGTIADVPSPPSDIGDFGDPETPKTSKEEKEKTATNNPDSTMDVDDGTDDLLVDVLGKRQSPPPSPLTQRPRRANKTATTPTADATTTSAVSYSAASTTTAAVSVSVPVPEPVSTQQLVVVRSPFFVGGTGPSSGAQHQQQIASKPQQNAVHTKAAKKPTAATAATARDHQKGKRKRAPKQSDKRDITPVTADEERLMLAQALSMSEDQSVPQILTPAASGSTPRDLAGFPIVPSPPSAKKSAPAFSQLLRDMDKDKGEPSPTPEFQPSSLQRSMGLLVNEARGSMWKAAATGTPFSSPLPTAKPFLVIPTAEKKPLGMSKGKGDDESIVLSSQSPSQSQSKEFDDPPALGETFDTTEPTFEAKRASSAGGEISKPGPHMTEDADMTQPPSLTLDITAGPAEATAAKFSSEAIEGATANRKAELDAFAQEVKARIVKEVTDEVKLLIEAETRKALDEISAAAASAVARISAARNSVAVPRGDLTTAVPLVGAMDSTETQEVETLLKTVEREQAERIVPRVAIVVPGPPQQSQPQPKPIAQSSEKRNDMRPPDTMTDAELRAAVKKYGIRPGTRAMMVELLTRVRNEHQQSDVSAPATQSDDGTQPGAPILATSLVQPFAEVSQCIRTDRQLYQSILQYKPIPFEQLKGLVQARGIHCTVAQLREFLTTEGVNFV